MKQLQAMLPGMIAAVAAADHGSFTAAARAQGLTPAAVSKNIASLEQILKVRIFNRTTRHLSLTEEGRALLAHSRKGLSELEAAAVVAVHGATPQGLVRVDCPVGFGRRYVLPHLPAFYAIYPDLDVELHLNDHSVDLVASGFDIGIRGGSQPPEGMVARKICNLAVALVASPKYLKKRGTPVHYRDLAHHDLLRVKFLNGRVLPWLFRDRHDDKAKTVAFEGRSRLLISDPEVIRDAALLHMGIAGLGHYDIYDALRRKELELVLPQQFVKGTFGMSIFYPHRAGLAPRVRVLVEYLLKQLGKEKSLQNSQP